MDIFNVGISAEVDDGGSTCRYFDVHIIAVRIFPRTEMHIGREVHMLNTSSI